jgi:hypothetical protein
MEAMLQVGREKQQKYDEGVQRIQSQIDQVAGLDVIKPVQRQYLQSKLNELGSKLKTVAAGDFSNFQLVNSVGGMTTHIAKDPIIQSAVASSQRIQKGYTDRQTYLQSGKSSVQNDAWWNNGVNSWMNDNDLKSSFNGEYIPYTDMENKLRAVADKVHEYDNSVQIPFKRDNAGNVIYYDKAGNRTTADKGVAQYDYAMLETTVKGKSAQKILDNFYDSLSENDMQQLKIDGWYHYRGYQGDAFKNKIKNDIVNTYSEKKQIANEEIAKVSAEIATNNKLTADQKLAKQSELNKYIDLVNRGELDKQMNDKISSIDRMGDTELKQQVYTDKFLSNLAKDISYQSIKTEFKDNPYFKADMDVKELNFKYWNAAREQKNADRTYNLAKQAHELEMFKLTKDAAGKDLIWEDGGIDTEGKIIPTTQSLADNLNRLNDDMINFANKNGASLIPGWDKLTNDQRQAAMAKIGESDTIDPKYNDNPEARRLFKEFRNMKLQATRLAGNYVQVANSLKPYDIQVDNVLKNQNSIADRNNVVHSARESYDVIANIGDILKPAGADTKGKDEKGKLIPQKRIWYNPEDIEKAKQIYKGTKYEALANAWIDDMTKGTQNATDKNVVNALHNLYDGTRSSILNVYAQRREAEKKIMTDIMPQYQTTIAALDQEDKVDAASIRNVITAIADKSISLGGLDTEKYNADKIQEWVDKKKATFAIRKTADNSSGYLDVISGKERVEIPLNAQQLQKWFPKAVKNHPLDDVKFLVMSSPTRTTNALGIRADDATGAITAAFSGDQLPLLQGTPMASLIRYDIEGATGNTGDSDTDLFSLKVYYNDNGKWKYGYASSDYGNLNNLNDIIQNLGMKKINEIKSKQ